MQTYYGSRSEMETVHSRRRHSHSFHGQSYMTLAQRSRGGKSTTNEGRACGATLEDHSAQCVLHSRLALMIVSIWINHEKKKSYQAISTLCPS